MTDVWAELRAPFPEDMIGKLPRSSCKACSDMRRPCDRHVWVNNCPECHSNHTSATIHLDYVGHADVTHRLLAVDPEWTWEPMALTPEGLPSLDKLGNLWIRLTIAGQTRIGVGDGKSMKECIGDAIRNAAMRFGVALDLWAKGDRDYGYVGGHDGQPRAAAEIRMSGVELALIDLANLCDQRGLDPKMISQDYSDDKGRSLRASTEAEIRRYIQIVRSGIPEPDLVTGPTQAEKDAAENPADPTAPKKARAAHKALVRDVLDVDSQGRSTGATPPAERLDKVPADDPFYVKDPS